MAAWLRVPVVFALAALVHTAPPLADETAPVIGLHSFTPSVTAFTNARIVIAPGNVLERAVLVVRDGRVVG